MMKIKGEFATRRVWLDGKELDPVEGQSMCNHSPDGFNWGYGGSGPAQLALTLCIEAIKVIDMESVPTRRALEFYQQLKREFVATLPQSDFNVEFDVDDWLCERINEANEAEEA